MFNTYSFTQTIGELCDSYDRESFYGDNAKIYERILGRSTFRPSLDELGNMVGLSANEVYDELRDFGLLGLWKTLRDKSKISTETIQKIVERQKENHKKNVQMDKLRIEKRIWKAETDSRERVMKYHEYIVKRGYRVSYAELSRVFHVPSDTVSSDIKKSYLYEFYLTLPKKSVKV